MPQTFNVGDTVALKSGGPTMTVAEIQDTGMVWCQWFVKDEPKSGSFHTDTLTRV